jgi:hypothetical protein
MHEPKNIVRSAAFALAIAIAATACTSKSSGSSAPTSGPGAPLSGIGVGTQSGGLRTPGPHAPPEVAIEDMAYNRLGGAGAPSAVQVTAVSVVGTYGLVLVQIGHSTNETLFKENSSGWHPLASDAYVQGGRGLLRFGISPELARQLDDGLKPAQ